MNNYFFLGGAPKCGTSSVYDALKKIQEIEASEPKETFYFIDKNNPLVNKEKNIDKSGIDGFLNLFDNPAANNKLECTTHLIYQDYQFENLKKLGSPKFVFILRNPIERLKSSFLYTKNNLSRFQKEIDFNTYVNLLLAGKEEQLEAYINHPSSLYVLQRDMMYGCYSNYLKKWYAEIGKENIKVVLFEEMKQSPETLLQEIVQFLNISYTEELNLGKKNSTKGIKHKKLHKNIIELSKIIPQNNLKQFVKKIYLGLQSNQIKPENLEKDTLQGLKKYYAPYNQELESMLQKNINW